MDEKTPSDEVEDLELEADDIAGSGIIIQEEIPRIPQVGRSIK